MNMVRHPNILRLTVNRNARKMQKLKPGVQRSEERGYGSKKDKSAADEYRGFCRGIPDIT